MNNQPSLKSLQSMMKKIIVLIFTIVTTTLLVDGTYAVTVEIPGADIAVKDANIKDYTIEGDSESIVILIRQINDYLRFSIAAVCMAVALYAGYQIIMSQGDKTKMQKGNQTLVGALIGIFIAVFSYVLVRLVVNLF
ncbi:hypothetical protein KBB05_00370 [Patescibacteria group bacterium]|nr:hypothetical protein [Patescibacteria group bacterium]